MLPPGDYKLVVESHAGDAAGPLQTSFRKVKYLRVEDPEPVLTLTGVRSPGTASPIIRSGSDILLEGAELDAWDPERDEISARDDDAEEPEYMILHGPGTGYDVTLSEGALELSADAWDTLGDELSLGPGSHAHFRVTIGGRSAEIVATVTEA